MRLATRWLVLTVSGAVVSVVLTAVVAVVWPGDAKPGRQTAQPPAASWGLDRINQRRLPLDRSGLTAHDGAGVTVYVVGSGIDYQHPEFEGRATFGYDAVGDGRRGADCHGLGTHVAGAVGGATLGVARRVSLVSVRVLDCAAEGGWSDLLAGLDWIADNAVRPAVVVVALTRPASPAVDGIANDMSDEGIVVAVAAGDSGGDACDVSPAGAARVVTVGVTTAADRYAGDSGRGSCVDLLAPGSDVTAAKLGGGTETASGSALAAAHVAGVAALYQQANGEREPSEITAWLAANATRDAVADVPANTPNRLLYTAGL